MGFETITNDNWLSYAMKHYDNPTLERDVEFNDDLKRFKYLKRLFRKYELTGNMKVRLAVNHIVVLHNVFNTDCATTLLLFKIDRVYWPILKSIMSYLNYLYPNELDNIAEDEKIKKMLKEIESSRPTAVNLSWAIKKFYKIKCYELKNLSLIHI